VAEKPAPTSPEQTPQPVAEKPAPTGHDQTPQPVAEKPAPTSLFKGFAALAAEPNAGAPNPDYIRRGSLKTSMGWSNMLGAAS